VNPVEVVMRRVLAVMAMMVVACDAEVAWAPRPSELDFVVDSVRSTSVGRAVHFRARNVTDRTLFILPCGSVGLERWEGTRWVAATSAICPAIVSEPIAIEPAAEFRMTSNIDIDGRHRIRASIQFAPASSFTSVYSASFAVR
jgi:hypothetical protein